jgi:ATP-dependent Clp protease protease subunit
MDTPKPKDVYLMFCGSIDEKSAQRIMNALNIASQQEQHAHIVLQCTGGMIGDGVCLHNYLVAFPGNVTLYNIGQIASMGLITFLGANERVAHEHSTFMMHSPTAAAVAMSPDALERARNSLNIDDARIKKIVESRVTVTPDQWTQLRHHELWFTAPDAVKSGIATRIGNFSPPAGSPIYTI